MAILLKSQAVFLHVPKTGGMWVNDVIRKLDLFDQYLGEFHMDMDRLVDYQKYYPRSYVGKVMRKGWRWHEGALNSFKFAFVRHPIRWYESYWNFMAGRWEEKHEEIVRGTNKWHIFYTLYGLRSNDFNEFMSRVLYYQPGLVSAMFRSYCDDRITFVGKQENLPEDLITALKMAGETFDPEQIRNWPRKNVSPSLKGEAQWDPKLKERVLEAERDGIVRFGYDQQGPGLAVTDEASRKRVRVHG